ncbi:MAG: hypothetical protein IPL70_04130 [Uliginosibacterium sp.]|nr:hypothetical protein [Uliginosibacterium sp.]
MQGLEEFIWRSTSKWSELVPLADTIIQRWNTVTSFVVTLDKREHIWTVRHSSVAAPFLVLAEDSLRGSVPPHWQSDGFPAAGWHGHFTSGLRRDLFFQRAANRSDQV